MQWNIKQNFLLAFLGNSHLKSSLFCATFCVQLLLNPIINPSAAWKLKGKLFTMCRPLTLLPVPLPTGGWHSAAWRTVHSMISIKAVSCLSVRATQTQNNEHHLYLFNKLHTHDKDLNNAIIPSSPGNGSSSNKLIMHSQSFSSSAPHSQRESTKYAACSWS